MLLKSFHTAMLCTDTVQKFCKNLKKQARSWRPTGSSFIAKWPQNSSMKPVIFDTQITYTDGLIFSISHLYFTGFLGNIWTRTFRTFPIFWPVCLQFCHRKANEYVRLRSKKSCGMKSRMIVPTTIDKIHRSQSNNLR